MSEKNFIPASELPTTEVDEVSVLCIEDGELKQRPKTKFGTQSWNDLKDKPFDSRVVTVTIVENQQMEHSADYYYFSHVPIGFSTGDTVTVEIRDNDDELVTSFTDVAIDNQSSVEDCSALPEHIYGENDWCRVYCIIDGGTYIQVDSSRGGKLTITATRNVVKKIDPKYLPDSDSSGIVPIHHILKNNRGNFYSEGLYEALSNFFNYGSPLILMLYKTNDNKETIVEMFHDMYKNEEDGSYWGWCFDNSYRWIVHPYGYAIIEYYD